MAGISDKTVLAVFAHPDDESFTVGGTLATMAACGATVYLVCATRGDVGEISDPSLATPETLTEVRERELRCSCEALGIQPPIILGYRDSGMAGAADNDHPLSLTAADPDEVASRVTRCIRELRPDIIFTFDPTGGYGHPDHIAIHKATTAAFHRAGDPSCYPEQLVGLTPHSPQRLLYTAVPRSRFREIIERVRESGMDMSALENLDTDALGTPDAQVNIALDISGNVDAKLRSMRCHATQANDLGPWMQLPEDELRALLSHEYFVQVEPPLQHPVQQELAEIVFR